MPKKPQSSLRFKINQLSDIAHRAGTLQDTGIPTLFWCGHYIDVDTKQVIPDGNHCCWWHWTDLPKRYGKRHPVYPWQEDCIEEIDKFPYQYIKKPPKVGASQLYLSWALHQACTNEKWINGQVAIVVGTHAQEADHMIERAKEIIAFKNEDGKPLRDKDGKYITKIPIDEDYNTRKEFIIQFPPHQ